MEIRFHVIKESKINIIILGNNKAILKKQKGFSSFVGKTHKEYRDHGQKEQVKEYPNSSFGYAETKNGVEYWVLPHQYNPDLDEVREDTGEVISQTLTREELKNFGFDVKEINK